MRISILNILLFITLISCNTKKTITPGALKTEDKKNYNLKSNAKPYIYNCQLIEKEFVNKGGKVTGIKELYLRCSVQDYFIKLCESNVSKKELTPYINKGINVEIEIKDGLWDHCSDNIAEVQSRMGEYIVIKSIQ